MKPRTLLIGTGNRDKAHELAHMLEGLPWNVQSLASHEAVPEPIEDGETFEANAFRKAEYYGGCFGVTCVADDSGLCVDALNGDPGVYSARYAGEGCTYADNNVKLLQALEGVPESKRTARFVCVAAFIDTDGATHIEQGTVEGRISTACRGELGFGYDPIFIPEGLNITFAEMLPAEKHRLSHRGRAFQQLRRYLENLA